MVLAHDVQHSRPLLLLEASAQDIIPVKQVVLRVLDDCLQRVLQPDMTSSMHGAGLYRCKWGPPEYQEQSLFLILI